MAPGFTCICFSYFSHIAINGAERDVKLQSSIQYYLNIASIKPINDDWKITTQFKFKTPYIDDDIKSQNNPN